MGVNLDRRNSTSGHAGITATDIRGMGPKLILIDGKPVTSRNSVRPGWRGERDTRGDTAGAAEMIERIEVLRGALPPHATVTARRVAWSSHYQKGR